MFKGNDRHQNYVIDFEQVNANWILFTLWFQELYLSENYFYEFDKILKKNKKSNLWTKKGCFKRSLTKTMRSYMFAQNGMIFVLTVE